MSKKDRHKANGLPSKLPRVPAEKRNVGSALEEVAKELEREEDELDRIHSLGFYGPQFEDYKEGLERRIEDLAFTARYLASFITKKNANEQEQE